MIGRSLLHATMKVSQLWHNYELLAFMGFEISRPVLKKLCSDNISKLDLTCSIQCTMTMVNKCWEHYGFVFVLFNYT